MRVTVCFYSYFKDLTGCAQATEIKLASQLADQSVFRLLHPPAGPVGLVVVAEQM